MYIVFDMAGFFVTNVSLQHVGCYVLMDFLYLFVVSLKEVSFHILREIS